MNKKEDLKSYIQALQEQQKSQESKNGITLWGIGAGLIYIVWKIISKISEIQELPSHETLLEALSLISIIIACTYLLANNYPSKNQRIFDYRFSPTARHTTGLTTLIILFLPVIITTLAFTYLIEHTSTPTTQKFSGFFFLFLLAIIFIGVRLASSNKDMPDVSSIKIADKGKTAITVYIALLTTFIYLMTNSSWQIIDGVITKKFSKTDIEVAFNLCLIPICIFIAKTIQIDERRSTELNKLQRDIYIHNISADEIERRLKEEFIGFHFDERLQLELDKIQSKIEAFIETAMKYEEVREKIRNISTELKYEIEGHKKEYKTELTENFNSYKNHSKISKTGLNEHY